MDLPLLPLPPLRPLLLLRLLLRSRPRRLLPPLPLLLLLRDPVLPLPLPLLLLLLLLLPVSHMPSSEALSSMLRLAEEATLSVSPTPARRAASCAGDEVDSPGVALALLSPLLLLIARRLIPRTTPVEGVEEPPSKGGAAVGDTSAAEAAVVVVAETAAAPFPSSVSISWTARVSGETSELQA